MGNLHTVEEQRLTLTWGINFKKKHKVLNKTHSTSEIREIYDEELKLYFALCGLSRSKTAPNSLVEKACDEVFRVRKILENSIQESLVKSTYNFESNKQILFKGWFYGASKKQGLSVRLPLTSCVPTKLCSSGCYAHDVLDAAPQALVRGVLNGVIAQLYEEGDQEQREKIENELCAHSRRAVKAAEKEAPNLQDWQRRPRIRFAHVGEIVAFPNFANAIARQVRDVSSGEVDCVVYTRHPQAKDLDPELWVVNFTLDKSSESRKSWIPEGARIVYSAWGGELSEEAEVNFLEHHRWSHLTPKGRGVVCPATAPETKVRTCDAVRCDRCFKRPASKVSEK